MEGKTSMLSYKGSMGWSGECSGDGGGNGTKTDEACLYWFKLRGWDSSWRR
jgi:hypothetical protein